MSSRRVVITGIGAVTPIGHGAAGLWGGVERGQSAVRELTRFDPGPFRSRVAAEIDDFDARAFLTDRRARRLDRFSQLAVVAAHQAMCDAELDPVRDLPESTGCYLGSALGGVAFAEAQHRAFLGRGAAAVSPALALSVFGGAAGSNIAIELGLRGPSVSNSNSCASGAIAVGEAFRLVRAGQAEVMLAGGAEAPLAPLTFGAFALIKAMSTAAGAWASRPFDVERDGFVMGEGSAVVVLEAADRARARGARVYAEVRGYATTNDAFHMLAPLADGAQAARAIRLALADAHLQATEVDYVNAHASATPIGDRAEAAAIEAALGDHAREVAVSGTKGLYGHPLGASGAIEIAIAALTIDTGFVPGTTNLIRPDADNHLRLVDPRGVHAHPRVVLKNAFGFGGSNAALVLSQPQV
ncbi:MAG: beta-ketoacyl-[acyl-carrier-protein] synthase family protein [Chloroflexi bacterium]|nr:beta-ketoacyl-[acyl-carrier-protein] synthase family protein [Chloroflexota bacterium]